MHIRLLYTALLLCTIACDERARVGLPNDAGPGVTVADGAITPELFVDEYKRVACGLVHGCCGAGEVSELAPWFGTTEVECIGKSFDVSVPHHVREGLAVFREDEARACLAALSRRICREGIAHKLAAGMDPFCSRVLDGVLAPGAECDDPSSCDGPASCAGPLDGAATCRPALTEGERCYDATAGGMLGACQSWLYCDVRGSNACRERLGLQQPCDERHPEGDRVCWVELHCVDGRCVPESSRFSSHLCL